MKESCRRNQQSSPQSILNTALPKAKVNLVRERISTKMIQTKKNASRI